MTRLKTLIRDASNKAGSQRKLAALLHTSHTHVSEWASGKQPCPDKHVLAMARIAGQHPITTAVEVYKERLGEVAKTLAIGAVVMLGIFGANDRALGAAGHGEPMRDDV